MNNDCFKSRFLIKTIIKHIIVDKHVKNPCPTYNYCDVFMLSIRIMSYKIVGCLIDTVEFKFC